MINPRIAPLQTALLLCSLFIPTLQQENYAEPRQRQESTTTTAKESTSSTTSDLRSEATQLKADKYKIEDYSCDYLKKDGSYSCDFDIMVEQEDPGKVHHSSASNLGSPAKVLCINEHTHEPVDMAEELDETISVICATISLSRRILPATSSISHHHHQQSSSSYSNDRQSSREKSSSTPERIDSKAKISHGGSHPNLKLSNEEADHTSKSGAFMPLQGFPKINFEPRIQMVVLSHYPEPLQQYGYSVMSFLEQWESIAVASFAIADGWHQLGALHRQEAITATDSSQRTQQLVWATKAFQMSNQNYVGLPSWHYGTEPHSKDTVEENDPWFGRLLKLRRAVVFYFWGEVLLLLESDQDQGMEMPIVGQSSTMIFQDATRLFQDCCGRVLFQDPPKDLDEASRTRFTREHSREDFLHELWNQARNAWAQALFQLGTREVQKSAESSSVNIESLQDEASRLMEELADESQEAQIKGVQELYLKQLPQLFTLLEKAESYLLQSIALMRLLLEEDKHFRDTIMCETARSLATALQNYATAVISKGDMVEGTRYLEQALSWHARNFEHLLLLQNDVHKINGVSKIEVPTIIEEMKSTIGEVLYSLANMYLQQGQYDKAEEHYTSCMDWYRNHQLSPSLDVEVAMDLSESIQQYEDALEQYQELFANEADYNHMTREMSDDGMGYQRDNGYEADLHNALATLYMTNGELIMAKVHLDQAIQLYSLSGEGQENYFADVMISEATLAFRQGQFDKSLESYKAAVEMYEKHYGDDESDLTMGMGGFDMSSYKSMWEQMRKDSQEQQSHSQASSKSKYEKRVEVDTSGATRGEVLKDGNPPKIRVLMTNDEDDFQNKTDRETAKED